MYRALAALMVVLLGVSQVRAESVRLHGIFPDGSRIFVGCVQLRNKNIVGGGEVVDKGKVIHRLKITSGSYANNVVTLNGHFVGSTVTFQIQAAVPNGPINVASNGQTSQAQGQVVISW